MTLLPECYFDAVARKRHPGAAAYVKMSCGTYAAFATWGDYKAWLKAQ